MKKIINLINGKIRTERKYNQIINNILNHDKYLEFKKNLNLKLNLDKDLKNHWLAGVSYPVASFQIIILDHSNRVEVRLNFQIDKAPKGIKILFYY